MFDIEINQKNLKKKYNDFYKRRRKKGWRVIRYKFNKGVGKWHEPTKLEDDSGMIPKMEN